MFSLIEKFWYNETYMIVGTYTRVIIVQLSKALIECSPLWWQSCTVETGSVRVPRKDGVCNWI